MIYLKAFKLKDVVRVYIIGTSFCKLSPQIQEESYFMLVERRLN